MPQLGFTLLDGAVDRDCQVPSIAVLLAETSGEAEEEVDALELVDDLAENLADGIIGGRREDGGVFAECFVGHGAVPGEGSVAEAGDRVEVLGHEPGDGNAEAGVDAGGDDEVGVLLGAEEEAEVDAFGGGKGDALHRGALKGAIAAPGSGEAEDVDGGG